MNKVCSMCHQRIGDIHEQLICHQCQKPFGPQDPTKYLLELGFLQLEDGWHKPREWLNLEFRQEAIPGREEVLSNGVTNYIPPSIKCHQPDPDNAYDTRTAVLCALARERRLRGGEHTVYAKMPAFTAKQVEEWVKLGAHPQDRFIKKPDWHERKPGEPWDSGKLRRALEATTRTVFYELSPCCHQPPESCPPEIAARLLGTGA